MELRLLGTKGIPEGSIISVKVGTVRRQAPLGSDRSYRFSGIGNGKQQMKVDVYAPVAHTRLLIEPAEAVVPVSLDSGPAANQGRGATLLEKPKQDMSLEFQITKPDICVSGMKSPGLDSDRDYDSVQASPVSASRASPVTTQTSRPSSAHSDRSSASRRHQVAMEAQPYFEQHHLMEVMQTLLQAVIKEKPIDPYAYMIRVLQNSSLAVAGRKRLERPQSAQARISSGQPLRSSLRGDRPSSAQKRRVSLQDKPASVYPNQPAAALEASAERNMQDRGVSAPQVGRPPVQPIWSSLPPRPCESNLSSRTLAGSDASLALESPCGELYNVPQERREAAHQTVSSLPMQPSQPESSIGPTAAVDISTRGAPTEALQQTQAQYQEVFSETSMPVDSMDREPPGISYSSSSEPAPGATQQTQHACQQELSARPAVASETSIPVDSIDREFPGISHSSSSALAPGATQQTQYACQPELSAMPAVVSETSVPVESSDRELGSVPHPDSSEPVPEATQQTQDLCQPEYSVETELPREASSAGPALEDCSRPQAQLGEELPRSRVEEPRCSGPNIMKLIPARPKAEVQVTNEKEKKKKMKEDGAEDEEEEEEDDEFEELDEPPKAMLTLPSPGSDSSRRGGGARRSVLWNGPLATAIPKIDTDSRRIGMTTADLSIIRSYEEMGFLMFEAFLKKADTGELQRILSEDSQESPEMAAAASAEGPSAAPAESAASSLSPWPYTVAATLPEASAASPLPAAPEPPARASPSAPSTPPAPPAPADGSPQAPVQSPPLLLPETAADLPVEAASAEAARTPSPELGLPGREGLEALRMKLQKGISGALKRSTLQDVLRQAASGRASPESAPPPTPVSTDLRCAGLQQEAVRPRSAPAAAHVSATLAMSEPSSPSAPPKSPAEATACRADVEAMHKAMAPLSQAPADKRMDMIVEVESLRGEMAEQKRKYQQLEELVQRLLVGKAPPEPGVA